MRKVCLSIFTLFCVLVSHAQIRLAVVGGVHQSNVIEVNNLPDWDNTSGAPDWNNVKKKYSPRTGVHFGFQAHLPFNPTSKFYFVPGINFNNKGRKFNATLDSTVIIKRTGYPDSVFETKYKYSQKEYLNYIDIPLNLVYKFSIGQKAKFVIGGGPYVSFFFNGSDKRQDIVVGISQTSDENNDLPVGKSPGQYKTYDYGVNALAGIEFNRVFITANYSRGLNDFYQSKDYEGTFRHQLIGGTLGIFLGQPVKIEKKIKDRDKDGIPDDQDACPDEAGSIINNGCPDKDGDGIADKDDNCPDEAGTKATNGCPDKDGDGIADKDDNCPDVAGLIRYKGCPVPDTDKDGINDEEDKCPDVAGYARYGGCPIPDTDGDGINDEDDKCPTVKGVKEKNGCPAEIKKEIVEKVNYAAKRIQFSVSKAMLLPESFKVLDEVVNLLNENPELTLLIEGHTSSDGSLAGNMKLSEERANTVQTYLISKGIDKARLTTKGLGPTQPINNGNSAADRAQNRRVELRLSN